MWGKEGSAYSKAMEDTVFQITDARFLSRVIEGIDEISSDGADMMGDVYEYMLGIMAASGTNGQFRTHPSSHHPYDGGTDAPNS